MGSTHATLASVNRAAAGRWSYAGLGLFAIAVSVFSFVPSAIDTGARKGPITALLIGHGLVYLAWLVLFVVQSLLVAGRKLDLHRRLGYSSIPLAALVVVYGYQVTITMGRRGYDMSGDLFAQADPLAAMGFPLLDVLLFLLLFAAAVILRRRPALHRRLMLLTIFAAMMPAPIGHITGHFPELHGRIPFTPIFVGLFLAASALRDLAVSRRVHPISIWLPLAIFVIENLCFLAVFPNPAWHRFAASLIH
ncbi:MAG: hypothetical protein WBF42_16830 [Terracidiphilus sp.]